MRRRFGGGRSVQQQWPHHSRAPSQGDTRYCRALTPVVKLVLGQPAMDMGGGQDLQRPVLISAVVNVEPDRYHLLEHVDRRLDMCDAFLC